MTFFGVDCLHCHWGRLLALGIATATVGTAAMIITTAAT